MTARARIKISNISTFSLDLFLLMYLPSLCGGARLTSAGPLCQVTGAWQACTHGEQPRRWVELAAPPHLGHSSSRGHSPSQQRWPRGRSSRSRRPRQAPPRLNGRTRCRAEYRGGYRGGPGTRATSVHPLRVSERSRSDPTLYELMRRQQEHTRVGHRFTRETSSSFTN